LENYKKIKLKHGVLKKALILKENIFQEEVSLLEIIQIKA